MKPIRGSSGEGRIESSNVKAQMTKDYFHLLRQVNGLSLFVIRLMKSGYATNNKGEMHFVTFNYKFNRNLI